MKNHVTAKTTTIIIFMASFLEAFLWFAVEAGSVGFLVILLFTPTVPFSVGRDESRFFVLVSVIWSHPDVCDDKSTSLHNNVWFNFTKETPARILGPRHVFLPKNSLNIELDFHIQIKLHEHWNLFEWKLFGLTDSWIMNVLILFK